MILEFSVRKKKLDRPNNFITFFVSHSHPLFQHYNVSLLHSTHSENNSARFPSLCVPTQCLAWESAETASAGRFSADSPRYVKSWVEGNLKSVCLNGSGYSGNDQQQQKQITVYANLFLQTKFKMSRQKRLANRVISLEISPIKILTLHLHYWWIFWGRRISKYWGKGRKVQQAKAPAQEAPSPPTSGSADHQLSTVLPSQIKPLSGQASPADSEIVFPSPCYTAYKEQPTPYEQLLK